MEIENQHNRNRRRVSFVPVNVNQIKEDIPDQSVIEKEKEELLIIYSRYNYLEEEEGNYKREIDKTIHNFHNLPGIVICSLYM